jgi:hypothetical protein
LLGAESLKPLYEIHKARFYLAIVLLAVICNQSVQWRRSHPEFRSFAREIGE